MPVGGGGRSRRHLHRYDATAQRRRSERERAGPRANIDQGARLIETSLCQESEVAAHIQLGLAVVACDIGGIEVLRSRVRELIERRLEQLG